MTSWHLESVMSVNAYLLEEQSCQISSCSRLKWQSLGLLLVKKLWKQSGCEISMRKHLYILKVSLWCSLTGYQ